jgi:hypothetical protein
MFAAYTTGPRVVAELDASLETVVGDLVTPPAAGERDQAVSRVAGRRDPELLAKPAARSAVVRDPR